MDSVQDSDVAEYVSTAPFTQTMKRLVEAIKSAGMLIFARIDHAAAARDLGMIMPPTTVLLYGHPKGGTPIMLAAPRAALDLPLRVLVREDQDGRVLISFYPVAPMLRRAGTPDALATRLEPAQHILVAAVTDDFSRENGRP
jgi:uncharacterized protein (DUF302 family)